MNRYDPTSSFIWLLVGLGIILWSLMTLKVGTFRHPGPAFVPLFCGIVISILAAIVFFQAKRNTQKITGESIYSEGSLVKTLSTIGILIVYGLMLERLGFIVTTFLVFLFIFKKVAGTSWFIGILESLIVTGSSYFIFGYLLKTPMPRGWLGF